MADDDSSSRSTKNLAVCKVEPPVKKTKRKRALSNGKVKDSESPGAKKTKRKGKLKSEVKKAKGEPKLDASRVGSGMVDPARVRRVGEGLGTKIKREGAKSENSGCVVYWMSRDQRVRDNWALLYAQQQACEVGKTLVVVFNVVPKFLQASARQFGFMLKGLAGVEKRLRTFGVPFILLTGDPVVNVPRFVCEHRASLLVTDFSPLRTPLAWHHGVAAKVPCPVDEVDAHNIVPVWCASPKIEYAARTIRPKINRQLPRFLVKFPKLIVPHPHAWVGPLPAEVDWKAVDASLEIDRSVPEVDWIKPGEDAARKGCCEFLKSRLKLYGKRNDPTLDACSNLSPWLHFGQLSAQRVALVAKKFSRKSSTRSEDVKSFLEELIVRRELTDNFCFYNPDGYDRLDGLYPQYGNNSWAQQSLREHAHDTREYTYTRKQFELGRTHDQLWNAAQLEMVHRGKMHGFMRMYWAKKILEWSPHPGEALDTAIFLNDKYELDGRDPNGYVGCAWAIAGLHDQGWRERSVFGKIRYMNFKGCQRKFNVPKYIAQVNKLVGKLNKRMFFA